MKTNNISHAQHESHICTLILTAPSDAICGLYYGVPTSRNCFESIDINNSIKPSNTVTSDKITYYYYSELEDGIYHYAASMDGYTSVCQIINYKRSNSTDTQIDIKMNRMAGNGYESDFILMNTPEFIEKHLISDKDAWGEEYSYLFNTPQFTRSENEIGRHQHTTNDELYDFITNLCKKNKHMHIFSLGRSPKFGFDMPLVLFTRENICGKDLEQTAEIIRNNGKPTVQYAAQVHANEPVSSEGALAMMLALTGKYGDSVLENVDVYIVPRINLDGAIDVIRNSPTTDEDMNRDYLRLNNRELCMLTSAYNLFLPEVVIDAHEKRSNVLEIGEDRCTDMEVQVGAGALNHPAEMTATAMEMALFSIAKGRDLNLRTLIYEDLASAAGGAAGSSYYGTRNSLSFLVETPGALTFGGLCMERRVVSQYVLASSVISYTAENSEKVMRTVHSSRDKMIRSGSVYNESDVVVLEHGATPTGSCPTPIINMITGEVANPAMEIAYNEHVIALHSRPRPTAYVIPAGLSNEEKILNLLSNHAVPYYALPEGSVVSLRQYIQKDSGITISDECDVRFDNGAFVFPNTVPSTVLSVIMEPDFNSSSKRKMTLFSMGLITLDENGQLPIYRYCHNLMDGKVEIKCN